MNEADIMQSDTSVRRCFEPGKLYRIDRWFWLLFPTKETAAPAAATTAAAAAADAGDPADAAARRDARSALDWASYWSKHLNCTVSFLNEGDTIMVVEVAGEQVKVISQEGKSGWINFPAGEEWTKNAIVESAKGVLN